ncbi:MAG: SIR2 family NAD-dependent protein deacylase, partial [Bacteroidota bacterium]
DFYNMRRRNVLEAEPNAAHTGLADLEAYFDVHIITQNIDDLHERGGSGKILHLHGEILKMRSEKNESLIYEMRSDIQLGHLAEDGAQLRPHIVWFEEPVPMMEHAIHIVEQADIFAVIGTSLVVYPAAGLVNYTPPFIPKFVVDKKIPDMQPIHKLTKIEAPATEGINQLKAELLKLI